MSQYLKVILQFLLLVLFQVLVLNNIRFAGYANPYLYILFILMLPYETPGWLLLIISFITGFTIDLFSAQQGIHTAATVFAGFLRPGILKLVLPKQDSVPGNYPSLQAMGMQTFLTYSVILVIIHHFSLYLLEIFRFSEIFRTMLRTGLSSLLTLLLIIITQYLFYFKRQSDF
ncbi:MAG: rod shape-determining protein MreD [Bacteroidales bacterium]